MTKLTKFSRVAAAFSVAAMLGVAVLPLTTYAVTNTSTTTVQVTVGEECKIGDGANGATANTGAANLSLTLSQSTPNDTTASVSNNHIGITCNSDNWTLTEQIDAGKTPNLVGTNGTTIGFTPWTAGTAADASDFSANTWAMKYTEVAPIVGNSVTGGAQAWHAVPANGSPSTIASGVAVAGYEVQQNFGAKTDGSLAADTYSSVILYTLTGTNTP